VGDHFYEDPKVFTDVEYQSRKLREDRNEKDESDLQPDPPGPLSRRSWSGSADGIRTLGYDPAAMSTFSSGDLTPRMMVLGLVVQQPDSAAGVARRLADEFAAAQFPKTSAHNNLPSLAEDGYVHVVEPGRKRSLDRYEATVEGIAHHRRWLRSWAPSPTIRDDLQGKLHFLRLDELAPVLQIAREYEQACRSAYHVAQARVVEEQEFRRRAKADPFDGHARLEMIWSKDEANMWSLHARRLALLRESLEELAVEMSADGDAQYG
jgi:DNA-binding PadR family transcriptional regulator